MAAKTRPSMSERMSTIRMLHSSKKSWAHKIVSWRVYRGHVKDAADLLARAMWNPSYGPYWHVGEVAESSKRLK